jgi:hypothetical protein
LRRSWVRDVAEARRLSDVLDSGQSQSELADESYVGSATVRYHVFPHSDAACQESKRPLSSRTKTVSDGALRSIADSDDEWEDEVITTYCEITLFIAERR